MLGQISGCLRRVPFKHTLVYTQFRLGASCIQWARVGQDRRPRPRSFSLGASEKNGVYVAYARGRLIAYQTAITRVGPPDAPFTFGSPTKTVAPRSGSFARFARFSSPHLLAGRTA